MASNDSPSQPVAAQSSSKPRKRMAIFRRQDAVDIQDHMPTLGIDASVEAGFGKLMAAVGSYPLDSGTNARLLFSERGDQGVSLSYVWFKSGYVLPRHSHNADCLYYVLAGELHLGTQTLRKGDGVFIPADAAYTYEAGPDGVEVLEFRNATRFHLMLAGNDGEHWDRIANVLKQNCPKWETERPPSDTLRQDGSNVS